MKIKLKKRKIIITLIVLTAVIILSVITYFIIRHSRLYDKNKPNIFEIPGTQSTKYHYYMVQKIPDNKSEIELMIKEYISKNNIVENIFSDGNTRDTAALWFFYPSMNFPVYFEENKNYFIMDDYVTHYFDNCFLYVGFEDENDKGDYFFYDEVLDSKLK